MDVPGDRNGLADGETDGQSTAFVSTTLSRGSIYIAIPISVLNHLFFLFALISGGGKTFSNQSAATRSKTLARWERASGITRDHIRLLRTLALIPYSERRRSHDQATNKDLARQ